MLKKDTHSPWLDLAVFAVIVGFFLFSAARLVKNNRAAPTETKEPQAINTRAPAAQKNGTIMELDLPCLPQENSRQNTNADFVRLSGGACTSGTTTVAAGHGRNQANGSEILCFIDQDRDRVSTNYFQLVPGINRVELNLVWSNGARRRSFLEIQKFTE